MVSEAELPSVAPSGAMEAGGGAAGSSIMLPPGVFPQGMTPKAGDKLVLGEPGQDGSIPCTLEAATAPDQDAVEKAKWDDGFRKHMSPVMDGEEAQ